MVSSSPRGKPIQLNVAVGRFYQILHANLPPRTPRWLRSVRIVMVSDKSKLNVTVKFPSEESIEGCHNQCFNPELDMCFIMGSKLAQRVLFLFRDVNIPQLNSLEEIKGFWLVKAPKIEIDDLPMTNLRISSVKEEVKEEVLSELGVVKLENAGDEAEADIHKIKKKKIKKRWSNERFESGKRVILNVLKGKNAGADSPVSRAALRKVAQKEIRDTGLLDHLLKDIPGKIAPDGISRFQRCYDAADGVMMYWLESADLLDVRKKAGVSDPFWMKVGSCPSTGCPCSKELELLKEELSQVKRDLEDTQKQLTEVRAAGDIRS